MASKTRDRLIEVARQLFDKKGVEHTTMNDIATASDKGRRTIYTYFKNKRDIYNAVIERESENLISRLREAYTSTLPPDEKLKKFLNLRIKLLGDIEEKRDNLMSFFSLDGRRDTRIRRLASSKVNEILKKILDEGINDGLFDPCQANKLPATVSAVIHGIELVNYHNAYEDNNIDKSNFYNDIIEFIITGVRKQ